MFKRISRVNHYMRFVRLVMLLSVPALSAVSYLFHKFIEQVNDRRLLYLLQQIQNNVVMMLKLLVVIIVLMYGVKLGWFLWSLKKHKKRFYINSRLHLIHKVFEGMKLPEEKHPKFDYHIDGDFLVLVIYKNFYIEQKMISDHMSKFEQVFNLEAVKIEQEDFDKIVIYFVLENKTLLLEDFNFNVVASELCIGQALRDHLVINLNLTPHLLIAGSNGSGKTSFMRFLYYQFKKKQDAGVARIILFDGKGIEFSQYQHESNIDNMHKVDRHEFEKKTGDIARLGRSAGFNLIIGLQRADAKIVQGEIKENMTKVLLGSATDEAKRIMFARTDVINQPRGSGNIQIDDTLSIFKFPYVE